MNKKPSNWIQGMSVAQRKKQGITTVQPSVRPKKAKKKPIPVPNATRQHQAIKKTANKIHYDVGQVDVEVNHSHMNKLRILKMTMENWEHNNGRIPMDSKQGRMYEADLHKVNELMGYGLSKKKEMYWSDKEFLTKEEMIDMNILFKTYGGERVTE